MKIRVILFDLGNVLIEWNPAPLLDRLLYAVEIEDKPFIKNCFKEWNQEWDRGRLSDGVTAKSKEFPSYATLMHAYHDHWIETLGQPIASTVDVLQQLRSSGYKLYAASNWAADTFELAKPRLPFLSLFHGIQISGQIGFIKPEAAFFQRMMAVYAFMPQEAMFIDDQDTNVQAARSLGISSIQFRNPDQLRHDLKNYNIFR